jgi:F0F1-type ATP synthase membrane subunit b/b'
MAVDQMLAALRRDLERDYGVEATSYLMDRPRGGWDALVTREHLHLELEALRQEFRADMAELRAEMAELRADLRAEMAELRAEISGARADLGDDVSGVRAEVSDLRSELQRELRKQTWRLATLVVAAQTVVVAAIAAIHG